MPHIRTYKNKKPETIGPHETPSNEFSPLHRAVALSFRFSDRAYGKEEEKKTREKKGVCIPHSISCDISIVLLSCVCVCVCVCMCACVRERGKERACMCVYTILFPVLLASRSRPVCVCGCVCVCVCV